MRWTTILLTAMAATLLLPAVAQHEHHTQPVPPINMEPQPLLAQALRLKEALAFLGSALTPQDEKRLEALRQKSLTRETVAAIQQILDPYCLAVVSINPEARVKVNAGAAPPRLMQNGWRSFLVKVLNDAGSTAQLQVTSPQAVPPMHAPSMNPKVDPKDVITGGEAGNRFLDIQLYRNRPLLPTLSGLRLEYAVVQIYSKDAGQREAEIGFNIGQGTQDIGFRNTVPVLFSIAPSVKVTLRVADADGTPVTASFTITDGVERVIGDSASWKDMPFASVAAQREYYYDNNEHVPAGLRGIYPLPSRRVAALDEYPDFFFHPQIYRTDGEHVYLPPGKYNVVVARGPEYVPLRQQIVVPAGVPSFEARFALKRWIHLSKLGYYSADHHVHGAGCSHYDSPEEGVAPEHMWRQIVGEDLNVAANLAWGPSWYHQKTFFTGKDFPQSTTRNILRNDVEVSGFPSSHAGHLVLLRIKEDDYPNTNVIEDWPSWTLPVLRWGKAQGGVVGYAHSGWGLEPKDDTNGAIFNDVVPKMDGIGANEYIVTVAHDAVDFFSLGDTPAPWELNMWYHTLNAGFRTRLSGETDFPCIFDERVGVARSYFKCDGPLTYDKYVDALKKGRGYVSDGFSHIVDFRVNKQEVGTNESTVKLAAAATVNVSASMAALMPVAPSAEAVALKGRAVYEQPYWHIERARLGSTRNVQVELIFNGVPVDTVVVAADGSMKPVNFSYRVTRSGWLALRIYPSAHTNPMFVEVNGKPVRERNSLVWCRKTVDQCWDKKSTAIRAAERDDAKKAYDEARALYDKRLTEAP